MGRYTDRTLYSDFDLQGLSYRLSLELKSDYKKISCDFVCTDYRVYDISA